MSQVALDATIIVCTRNRAQSLRRTLESFTKLSLPRPNYSFEVLVVNNGSTDNTSAVISSFEGRLPIRELNQPIPGLSVSRNAGIKNARGEYILWTDDDVVVGQDWLSAYAAAFGRANHAFFGGRIRPILETVTPTWFTECLIDLDDLLGGRDFGDEPLPLTRDRLPFGANFAVRTDVQRNYLYDPLLGVGPGRRRGGEETAVMEEMLCAGYSGVYVPDSYVEHMIPPSRQTRGYVRDYYQAQGETVAIWKIRSADRASVLWLVKQYGTSAVKMLIAGPAYCFFYLLRKQQKAVRYLKTFARAHGTFNALGQREEFTRLPEAEL